MEINEIKERMAKKEAAIQKAIKLADKYSAGFDNEDKELIKKSINSYKMYSNEVVPALNAKYNDDWGWDVKGRDAESARTNFAKVAEYTVQLEKYKNALNAAEVKQGKLDAPRIKVIVDFLEDWKMKVTDYVERNMKVLLKYYKVNSEYCEWHNNHHWMTYQENPEHISEDEWKAKYKELKAEEKRLREAINPLTSEVYDRSAEDKINRAKLAEILNKQADDLYLDMVERVTEITGEINDASGLHIGYKGDLEGIIIGNRGKAKIETIGAGGYNTDHIVNVKRGPVYHFRTLINPIK